MSVNFKFKEKKTADGSPPKQLVIFLHGYGSNEEDLMSISDNLSIMMQNAHFISIQAPFECEAGFGGYQWFSLSSMIPMEIFPKINATNNLLNEFIDQQLARLRLKDENLFLIGFSQGSAMALFNGVRRENKIMGIASMSGLVGDNMYTLTRDIKSRPNVIMVHGTSDSVVPYENMETSVKMLEECNIPVHTYSVLDMNHTINSEAIQVVKSFIMKLIK